LIEDRLFGEMADPRLDLLRALLTSERLLGVVRWKADRLEGVRLTLLRLLLLRASVRVLAGDAVRALCVLVTGALRVSVRVELGAIRVPLVRGPALLVRIAVVLP
jgi:hypothetical protein